MTQDTLIALCVDGAIIKISPTEALERFIQFISCDDSQAFSARRCSADGRDYSRVPFYMLGAAHAMSRWLVENAGKGLPEFDETYSNKIPLIKRLRTLGGKQRQDDESSPYVIGLKDAKDVIEDVFADLLNPKAAAS